MNGDMNIVSIRPVPKQRIIDKMDEYMSRRDYKGAERHLLYWLTEAKLGGDLEGQLMLRNELVGHYRKTGQKGPSIENGKEALSLLAALDMEKTITAGTTYVNLATAHGAFGEHEEAIRLFEKARAVYEDTRNIAPQLLGGLVCKHAAAHLDARFAEHGEPPARDLRIGILHSDDDARDARLRHSLCTRARTPVVGARLERHVERRPAGEVARHAERVDLGVRRPGLSMPSLRDDAAVAHDDGTDERIRARAPFRIPRDAQRLAHEIFICQSHHLTSFLLKTDCLPME